MARKSAKKKTKTNIYIYVVFFQTYIFWRTGRGQIGDKKMNKMYVCFFSVGRGGLAAEKLNKYVYFFLDGWSRENLRQKKLNTRIYICNIIKYSIYIHNTI